MTLNKRQVARRAFDPDHKALMLAYSRARGGERLKALAALKAYVTKRLQEARQ